MDYIKVTVTILKGDCDTVCEMLSGMVSGFEIATVYQDFEHLQIVLCGFRFKNFLEVKAWVLDKHVAREIRIRALAFSKDFQNLLKIWLVGAKEARGIYCFGFNIGVGRVHFRRNCRIKTRVPSYHKRAYCRKFGFAV